MRTFEGLVGDGSILARSMNSKPAVVFLYLGSHYYTEQTSSVLHSNKFNDDGIIQSVSYDAHN